MYPLMIHTLNFIVYISHIVIVRKKYKNCKITGKDICYPAIYHMSILLFLFPSAFLQARDTPEAEGLQ